VEGVLEVLLVLMLGPLEARVQYLIATAQEIMVEGLLAVLLVLLLVNVI
jgi:hypothetical protein